MDQASGSLGGSTLLLPDDARVRIQDTQLRVLNPVFDGSELTVPIICTALVSLVLSLVPQPWHIQVFPRWHIPPGDLLQVRAPQRRCEREALGA